MATIKRDNEAVAEVADADVLPWFHKRHGYSMSHALKYEGYSVEYSDGTVEDKNTDHVKNWDK